MMTEKKAWLMIRDAFQRYVETGEDSFLAHTGICRAISILSRHDVWQGHKKYGLPVNKLYLAGFCE